jgi:uncharacterized protein (TIGR03067 family)
LERQDLSYVLTWLFHGRLAMRRRTTGFAVIVLFTAGSLLLAGGGREDAVKKDLETFKGVFTIVSAEKDGKKYPDEELQGVTVKCDGDKVSVQKGDKALFTGTMKIDPTKKPKTIDTTQDSDGDTKGKTFPGIYEIKGDTIKICTAAPGKERPTEFAAKAGSGSFYRVYKREKK